MDNVAPTDTEPATTPQTVKDSNRNRFQNGFGCFSCRPACLQFVATARWFLVFICIGCFFESLVVNGLLGTTISTVERRFALSSSQTAWIAGTYEVVGVPALLVVGYLGMSLHRPAWIGGGLVMLGVGVGIYSIPHFAAPPYRFSGSGESNNLCVEPAWNTSNISDR